jgi:hypothetical protein
MKNFITILLISAFFTACSKENSDVFSPYANNPVNDTTWTQQIPANASIYRLLDMIALPAKVDSFNAASGATVKVSEFLQTTFSPGAFTLINGTPVTGIIKVEIIYLRKKGDLVRLSKPTTSFGKLLKNAGSFFIRATKDGQELVAAPSANIRIKFTDASPMNDMRVFQGIEGVPPPFPPGTNPAFTWTPSQDSSRISTYQQVDSFGTVVKGYELTTKKLRWVSANFFYDTVQTQRTRLDVLLPLNFTNNNTTVFAVFNNEKIVVQLNPELSSKSFNAVNMPVGKSITIITLSKVGDALYMSAQPVVTAVNHPESLVPQLRTYAQIMQFLDSL